MAIKYNYKWKKRRIPFYIKIIKILAITMAMLALTAKVEFLAIRKLYDNKAIKIIQQIDTNLFRNSINHSMPIISITYSNGGDASILSEAKNIVKNSFGIDFGNIITVLNAEYPILRNYHDQQYIKSRKQAEESIDSTDKIPNSPTPSQTPDAQPSQVNTAKLEDSEKKKKDNYGFISNGKISIKNETGNKINIDELMKEPLKLNFDRKGPQVLIYHTHTTESYIEKLTQLKDPSIPSRKNDPACNVVRVGEEISKNLKKKYNIGVIHNSTVHTYPSDKGSYARSLGTASKILRSYPSISIVLDIHRDGLGGGEKLRTVTDIGNKKAAKIMFVVGSNKSGLEHPNWQENLKFALYLQNKLNEQYPGLAKPIYLSENRYNQHLNPGTLIIEIGGDGNLLSEALESTKYLSKVINDTIKTKSKK